MLLPGGYRVVYLAQVMCICGGGGCTHDRNQAERVSVVQTSLSQYSSVWVRQERTHQSNLGGRSLTYFPLMES